MSSDENRNIHPADTPSTQVPSASTVPNIAHVPSKSLPTQQQQYQQSQYNNYQGKPYNTHQKSYNRSYNQGYNPNYVKTGPKNIYNANPMNYYQVSPFQQPIPQTIPQTLPQTLPEKPILSSPVKKNIPIVIKTKTGKPIDLQSRRQSFTTDAAPPTNLHASAPVIANTSATIPTAASNVTATTSVSNSDTSKPSSSTVNSEEEKKRKQQLFKEMIQRKADEKKRAKAIAAGLIPDEPKEESKEKSKDESKEEPKETPKETPKEELKKESKEESNEEFKQDSKEILKEELKEEPKEEPKVESEKEVMVELNQENAVEVVAEVSEQTAESDDVKKTVDSQIADLKAEDSEASNNDITDVKLSTEDTETTTEVTNEESAPEDERSSMTQFFERIALAKEVQDPFTFSYNEGINGPNPGCKSETVKRYDPGFLLQFDKLSFKVDDEWKAKYVSKIYIPERGESRDRSMRGKDSRSRSNGPLRGINLRNDFDGRNNSRNGSKRKGRDGRDGRDNREKSRRSDREGSKKSRGLRGEKEDDDKKPVIKIAPEDVKLEQATNRWTPKFQAKTDKEIKYAPDGTTILYDLPELQKKIRSLLNKLSLEKFDTISDELIQLANQSKWETNADALKACVRLTFAKATDEPHWSQMYAKFCQKLVKDIDPEVYSEDYTNPKSTGDDDKYFKGTNLAYRLLVSRCQTEYEKGWSTDLPTNEDGTPIEPELMSDEYYDLAAQKRRGLGLVRFIGELYRLNLIKSNVIIGCIKKLTADKRENPSPDQPYLPQEDTLETINQFLLTVGEKLEREVPPCIAFAFNELDSYINNPAIPARIKFKLLDLIDLRKARWKDASSKLAGPKTISEIHAEYNQQQQKASQEHRERSQKRERSLKSRWSNDISSNDLSKVGMIRKGGESSISALRRGAPSATMTATTKNEFTTVGSPRSKSLRGTTGVSRSSSTTSIPAVEESESRQQSTNSFAALMGGDEDADSDDEDADADVDANVHADEEKSVADEEAETDA